MAQFRVETILDPDPNPFLNNSSGSDSKPVLLALDQVLIEGSGSGTGSN